MLSNLDPSAAPIGFGPSLGTGEDVEVEFADDVVDDDEDSSSNS